MIIENHLISDFPVAQPYQSSKSVKNILLRGDAVIVRDQEKFLGVLTLNDLIRNPHNLVIDCLTQKPILHGTDSSLPSLMFMCQNNYEFLPVIDDEQFKGVVSRKMLFLKVLGDAGTKNPEQYPDEMLELKKEISLKNKFLTIIGHDIKNLFSQVLGSLELLDHRLEDIHEPKTQTILKLAQKSVEQVNATFEGMLLWARLSTGQLPFQTELLNLNEQINKIVNQFQLAGNIKNISIRSMLDVELRLLADPNMLSCILLNLVYNAIKFTPPGGEVWINASKDDMKTEIVVVDSGTGMSLMQQHNLFKTGQSSPGTHNEIGAGIGLIICREFVEKHQGTIAVESEQSKGTRVIVSFPNITQADLEKENSLTIVEQDE